MATNQEMMGRMKMMMALVLQWRLQVQLKKSIQKKQTNKPGHCTVPVFFVKSKVVNPKVLTTIERSEH